MGVADAGDDSGSRWGRDCGVHGDAVRGEDPDCEGGRAIELRCFTAVAGVRRGFNFRERLPSRGGVWGIELVTGDAAVPLRDSSPEGATASL